MWDVEEESVGEDEIEEMSVREHAVACAAAAMAASKSPRREVRLVSLEPFAATRESACS